MDRVARLEAELELAKVEAELSAVKGDTDPNDPGYRALKDRLREARQRFREEVRDPEIASGVPVGDAVAQPGAIGAALTVNEPKAG